MSLSWLEERLVQWLVDVSLEAAESGRGRPGEPGAEPAERPQSRNSAPIPARPRSAANTTADRRR